MCEAIWLAITTSWLNPWIFLYIIYTFCGGGGGEGGKRGTGGRRGTGVGLTGYSDTESLSKAKSDSIGGIIH
jgi:hypothetical protein